MSSNPLVVLLKQPKDIVGPGLRPSVIATAGAPEHEGSHVYQLEVVLVLLRPDADPLRQIWVQAMLVHTSVPARGENPTTVPAAETSTKPINGLCAVQIAIPSVDAFSQASALQAATLLRMVVASKPAKKGDVPASGVATAARTGTLLLALLRHVSALGAFAGHVPGSCGIHPTYAC